MVQTRRSKNAASAAPVAPVASAASVGKRRKIAKDKKPVKKSDAMDEDEKTREKKPKVPPLPFQEREQHPFFKDSPLNVDKNIDFGDGVVYGYRRTSTKKGEDDKYHHQLSKAYNRNTIFAYGVSAFNREDIFSLIKFLINNGSRFFTLDVIDETRFSRNTVTCLKIYDFLMSNNTTFFLCIDGVKYDYVKDYFSKLREKFIETESSSLEKSRISKKSYQAKKGSYRNKKVLREHFINMMFALAGKKGYECVVEMAMTTGMKSLNPSFLKRWHKKNKIQIDRMIKRKSYTYVKCSTSGNYFTVPTRFTEKKDLFFKALGFGGDDVMKKFFTDHLSLNYLCFPAKDIEEETMEQEPPVSEPPVSEPPVSEEDKIKHMVGVYHSQHQNGEISIDQLTEKMSSLFSSK
jgi:hypothetical protein